MQEFELPAHIHTDKGKERRVGYELEYAGVDLDASADFLVSLLGGAAERCDAFRYQLDIPELGIFILEIDAAILQDGNYKDYLSAAGIDLEELSLESKLDEIVRQLAAYVVPNEVVTPPLPVTDMQVMEDIAQGLRKLKAQGTGKSVFYAFGLHINPEIVSDDANYLLNHMRAFSLLYDWICQKSKVDFSRKMAPYIKPYSASFLKLIMAQDYRPDITQLIDDYLALVETRNHALDMLPVFANIDEDRVKAGCREPDLVKARPAFHYRLANSLIDCKGWRIATEWNYWVKIEKLADDQQQLMQLCQAYQKGRYGSMLKPSSTWVEYIDNELSF